jgi:TolB protein
MFGLLALVAATSDSVAVVRPPDDLFVREFSFTDAGRGLLFTAAFERGQRAALFRCGIDGADPRAVTDTSGWRSWGALAPDGRQLAFIAGRDSGQRLWIRDLVGGGERRVTPGDAVEMSPAWSPDGRRLAFTRRDGDHFRVWTMRADGREARAVGRRGVHEYNPVWSPDGQWLALYQSTEGADSLVVMRADGRDRRVLTEGLWPHWSPDGQWLVFARPRGRERPDIWRKRVDGGDLRFVAHEGFFARYTPDGSRIAFLRPREQGFQTVSELWWARPDGSGQERLLPR